MRLLSLALALVCFGEVGCVHKRRSGAAAKPAPPPPPAAPVAAGPLAAPTPAPEKPVAVPAGADPKRALLPFPSLPRDAQGQDLIHVRVYPHPKGDPWNGGKERLDQVSIVGPCKSYRGAKDRVAKGVGGALQTKPRIDLTLASVKEPLWIECDQPASIDRGTAVSTWRYLGAFYAHANGKSIEIINAVPIEAYLRGVLPSEVIPSWPAETLKAQAITSRTYAYYNVAHNAYYPATPKRLYDVDDTPFFQVYTGVTNAVDSTDEALLATAKIALSHSKRAILAFFSTDAGGFTESAQEVFGLDAPYMRAKKEEHDLAGTKTEWAKLTPKADLAKKLGLTAGRFLKDVKVEPSQKTASGRIRAVSLILDDGSKKTLQAPEFKKATGAKSALFTATVLPNGDLKLDGKGSGHGVGLGQKGSKELAKQLSWDYKKILSFYFDGTILCGLGSGGVAGLPKCGESGKVVMLEPEMLERGKGAKL